MKSKIIVILSAVAFCGMPVLSHAAVDEISPSGVNNLNSVNSVSPPASDSTPNTDTRDVNAPSTNAYSPREQQQIQSYAPLQLGVIRRANQLIGMKVVDRDGQKIGHVKDLVLDLPNGRLVEVIVASGGFLGMSERFVAVPPSSFNPDFSLNQLQAKFDEGQLKNASEFRISSWSDSTQKSSVLDSYQAFGAQPYFVSSQTQGTGNVDNSSSNGQLHQQRGQLNQTPSYYSSNGNNGNQASLNQPIVLGPLASANKLIGAAASNTKDERIGTIENFLVDLANGRVVEVIVSTGGAMGAGSQLTAVPPQAFQWNGDTSAVTLDTTPDMLHNGRQFNYTDWSTANDPNNIADVYSTYHVQPYFATAVDNTARNVRDRSSDALTAQSSGNSKWEVQTTANIRKALMNDQNLSTDAKNVKIIVTGDRVTLRGVVASEDEKRTVNDAAVASVGADKVDNQLEVLGSNTSHTSDNMTPTQAPVSDMNK
jgi:sporulation protein YlmC with PRC-barrel domain